MNSNGNIDSKPVYNKNLESYDNFIKSFNEKDELWDSSIKKVMNSSVNHSERLKKTEY